MAAKNDTPRTWLIRSCVLWLKDNPGTITTDRVWDVIEGRARFARQHKPDSAVWTYYCKLDANGKGSTRLIREIVTIYEYEMSFSKGR